MAIPWQLARCSLYEQENLLRAAFNLPPNIPAYYRARISTTQPMADGTGVTEYSGNGYSPVAIPSWTGPLVDGTPFTDPTLPIGQQSVDFSYCIPTVDIQFPNPTAPWWADGTTFYVYLTDDSTNNLRWWWQAAITPAPFHDHPLLLRSVDPADGVTPKTAIGCAVQDIGNAPTRIYGNIPHLALSTLTSILPINTDPVYASMGTHFNLDGTDSASPNEPDDLSDQNFISGFNFFTTVGGIPPSNLPAGLIMLGGSEPGNPSDPGTPTNIGVSSVKDASYVQKTASWEIATDGGGYKIVRNSVAIDWTVGSDTEDHHVSGAAMPSIFPMSLVWTSYVGDPPSLPITLLRGTPSRRIWAIPNLAAITYPTPVLAYYQQVFFPWQPYELAGDDETTRTNSTPADYSSWNYLFEIYNDGSAFNSSFGTMTATDFLFMTFRTYYNPDQFTFTPSAYSMGVTYIPSYGFGGGGGGGGAGVVTWVPGDHLIIAAHAIKFRIR